VKQEVFVSTKWLKRLSGLFQILAVLLLVTAYFLLDAFEFSLSLEYKDRVLFPIIGALVFVCLAAQFFCSRLARKRSAHEPERQKSS
jgi:hypothetical protein